MPDVWVCEMMNHRFAITLPLQSRKKTLYGVVFSAQCKTIEFNVLPLQGADGWDLITQGAALG